MKREGARSSKASIKLILTVVLSILSLMVLGTLSWIGTAAWKDYSIARSAKDFDASTNRFVSGLYEVLLERVETNNALQAAEPASAAVIAKIEASRQIIKDNFDIGLAGIDHNEFPNKESLLQDLKAALQKANDYRRQADAAIKLPRDQRDETLRKTFLPTITKSVNAALKVWFSALYSTAKHDPQLQRLATIKELGFRLRDYAGQQRSMIASSIASNSAIPVEAWATIAANRARIAALWDVLQNLTADAGTNPAIVAAVHGAQQKYFHDFLSLSNEMKKISDAGGKYPISAAQWVDTTTPQIGSMIDVLYSAAKASETFVEQVADRSLRELLMIIALLVINTAIAATSLWTVIARVTRPLSVLSGVLTDLTNDRIVDVPYVTRGDEVGAIAKATEVFKQSIAEKIVNLRVRSALDVVRSNIMVADTDYNIMYANNSLKSMLYEAESELRKVLPNFDASKLIAASMDVFHKNPAHQRRLLDSLTGIHETHIAVGSQKFHLVATPVTDQHGKRAGTIVEWRNETVEKAIEAEVDGLVKAAVAGDFSQRVPLEGKKEFMLNLATAMNALCDNTGKALQDLIAMLSALAGGDMTPRITAEYHGMFGKLKDDANTMAERIGSTIAEIKASAAEVTNASAEISTSTTDLSQRTEEQAASLEQTSASMEEIASTVRKNAENAQAANQSASATRDVADRGGQVVAQAVEAMAKIEESSRKISDIIGVIDEIARQTNLLALNAAVEAARAGEAGRGFAVVASEVRSLAQRSSQAAKDIKDLITNSNGQVKDGVDLVNRAGASLTEIVDSIKKVADIVADIANASNEQATGIEQVNKALTQMDEVTQQNSALVEENAATAKTLEHQAKAMDGRVSFFKLNATTDNQPVAKPAVHAAPTRQQRPAAAPPARGPAAARQPAAPKQQPTAAPKRAAAATNAGGPVRRMQTSLATAVNAEPDWKEF